MAKLFQFNPSELVTFNFKNQGCYMVRMDDLVELLGDYTELLPKVEDIEYEVHPQQLDHLWDIFQDSDVVHQWATEYMLEDIVKVEGPYQVVRLFNQILGLPK